MKLPLTATLPILGLLAAGPAAADDFAHGFDSAFSDSAQAPQTESPTRGDELPAFLQCVPYARQVSGIAIYGDAYTWWNQAEGRYSRGHMPRAGAVMAFQPTARMELGHVATVSRVIDSRTVLLDHANWSPINGRRGQVERGVMAVDVSEANDWSEVRVWYNPIHALGTTAWPVYGFIYPEDAPREHVRIAKGPTRLKSSDRFVSAFGDLLD